MVPREIPSPLILDPAREGGFCWLDLAASDAGRARDFYARASS